MPVSVPVSVPVGVPVGSGAAKALQNGPLLVADRDIPFVRQYFADTVRLRLLEAAEFRAARLADADALLVRSVTPVGAELLSGSRVRFVATATSGTDHLDVGWLKAAGIGWGSGAGGNADAVVDYVLAAIGLWHKRHKRHIAELRCGLVGAGRIGGQLRRLLRRVGAEVLAWDPLRADCGDSLQQVLDCDIVSLHLPLHRRGPRPTRHLLSAEMLEPLRRRSGLLINTARGEVLAPDALRAWAGEGSAADALSAGSADLVLDVWPDESAVDAALVRRCSFCSPHIAGHTMAGRLGCLRRAAEALLQHMGLSHAGAAGWLAGDAPWQPSAAQLQRARRDGGQFGLPVHLLATVVPLRRLTAKLQALAAAGPAISAADFQQLRAVRPRRQLSPWTRLQLLPAPAALCG